MAPVSRRPSFARRFGAVFGLGLLGVAALATHLAPRLPAMPLPESLAGLPSAAILALSLLNPLILLLLASLAGAAVAHRTGLHSAAAGTTRWPAARQWTAALASGVALGLLIAAVDAAWARAVQVPWIPAGGPQAAGAGPLLLGVFYGGLAEEVLMRWGLMALAAWALQRWLGRGPALAVAAVFAALAFAAGHLPALLAAQQELTGALVARTLALNATAGLLYGWWFGRHSLEAAMAAHAATHLGFWLAASAL
ncbi:CPBP family glutamic-type intramembrane protease [Ramlibacter tataouinensis]|uniref:CPBP family glutamic-type intramembrane protease n=1 Tax=Ramlibacter tataouinensis TaxID=94132 RepID=UPI0022F3B5FC|nr:CPBP family glutamic-type intramembrane protease [Ramlibacter tataouinensis]WBX99954.1 CPBP family glutamic-type intramembrane protease [Ramlibacter tataouinensis]